VSSYSRIIKWYMKFYNLFCTASSQTPRLTKSRRNRAAIPFRAVAAAISRRRRVVIKMEAPPLARLEEVERDDGGPVEEPRRLPDFSEQKSLILLVILRELVLAGLALDDATWLVVHETFTEMEDTDSRRLLHHLQRRLYDFLGRSQHVLDHPVTEFDFNWNGAWQWSLRNSRRRVETASWRSRGMC
jgi:hypothetical protein